jgi:hypothetical protein
MQGYFLLAGGLLCYQAVFSSLLISTTLIITQFQINSAFERTLKKEVVDYIEIAIYFAELENVTYLRQQLKKRKPRTCISGARNIRIHDQSKTVSAFIQSIFVISMRY